MMKSEIVVIKDENYNLILEEVGAALTEGYFTCAWTLIETYHNVGKVIYDAVMSGKYHTTGLVRELSSDLSRSEKIIYDAYKFYKMVPELEKLPGGKSMTWTRVRKEILNTLPSSTDVNYKRIVNGIVRRYGVAGAHVIGSLLLTVKEPLDTPPNAL